MSVTQIKEMESIPVNFRRLWRELISWTAKWMREDDKNRRESLLCLPGIIAIIAIKLHLDVSAGWWMYSENETDKLNMRRKGFGLFWRVFTSMFMPIKAKKIAQNTSAACVLTRWPRRASLTVHAAKCCEYWHQNCSELPGMHPLLRRSSWWVTKMPSRLRQGETSLFQINTTSTVQSCALCNIPD